jgi:hypothetical protein
VIKFVEDIAYRFTNEQPGDFYLVRGLFGHLENPKGRGHPE